MPYRAGCNPATPLRHTCISAATPCVENLVPPKGIYAGKMLKKRCMGVKKKGEAIQGNSWYEKNRCQWREGQAQCQMFGSISPGLGADAEFFCSWHYYCLERPQSNNYQEFGEWLEKYQRWDVSLNILWEKVCGNYHTREE